MQCCAVLCCAVLCCAVLCFVVRCCCLSYIPLNYFGLVVRCCCSCWDSFAFWLDQRNTQNNLPVFRLLYFSATVVYFAVILGVAAGGIKR